MRELRIPNAHLEFDDFELEIVFESDEIDAIVMRLKEAKQRGRFIEWFLSYDLCGADGFILQEGLISEDSSIFRYPNGNVGQ
jgi:hypothetical protein